jgi:glycosyltransferase involved in cell wall biosynthesis
VPPEDPRALAEACAALLTKPGALQTAYEGVLAARAALTWKEAARAHEQIYEALAETGLEAAS